MNQENEERESSQAKALRDVQVNHEYVPPLANKNITRIIYLAITSLSRALTIRSTEKLIVNHEFIVPRCLNTGATPMVRCEHKLV